MNKPWYKKPPIIFLIIFCTINIILAIVLKSYFTTFMQFIEIYKTTLCEFVATHYIMSACLYIALYIIDAACALPVTSAVTLLGGFLFGRFYGALYAIIGATLGGTCAFLTARRLWGISIQQQYAQELEAVNQHLRKHSIFYLLLVRLLPIVPFSLFNIIVSVTTVSLRRFIWTTGIGIIPNAFLYAHLGSQLQICKQLEELKSSSFIAPLVIIGILAVAPFIWQYIKKLLHH